MCRRTASFAIVALIAASTSLAQTGPVAGGAGAPPVIRFTGTLAVAPGLVPVTFGLYQEETGGTPLWVETQALPIDAAGRYTVLLGINSALPTELFVSGEARWLDVAVEGLAPQPRRLLVSVPYALKAADSETIGGRPLSAFLLAGDRTGVGADGLTYVDTRVLCIGDRKPAFRRRRHAQLHRDVHRRDQSRQLGDLPDAGRLSRHEHHGTAGGVPRGLRRISGGVLRRLQQRALGALPVVYRAARGTASRADRPCRPTTSWAASPCVVTASTTWSTGRGQVMYKAAENWTDTANGTYLQFTTTPARSVTWAERMRIAPDGKVGIGTATPAQLLSVAGAIESTAGGFKFPDGTTQTTALSLASNTFTATQTISSGNLALPRHRRQLVGVLTDRR